MKKFITILLSIILIFIIYSTVKMGYRRYLLEQETKVLQSRISTTENKNEELSNFIYLNKSKTFQEQEARERFNLKKPGENIVLIFEDQAKKEGDDGKTEEQEFSEDTASETSKKKSNPQKWIEFLFVKNSE